MLLTIMILLIATVAGTCEVGDVYSYSDNQIEIQRCEDEKYFYYTSEYQNDTFCLQSDSLNPGKCWWDTTVESHCLESEECIWLDDNIAGGACYCAKSTDCEQCVGMTPSPTFSSTGFQCPVYCKVYYVGCVGMYCNCFGECADALELGCIDPINPECHTWITQPSGAPTFSPTLAKAVYWSSQLCCFEEYLIAATTSSVARALGLYNDQVIIFSYKLGERRGTELDPEWEVIYEIGLEENDSTEPIMTSLENTVVLNWIAEAISAELGVKLQNIETIRLSENPPPYEPTANESAETDSIRPTVVNGSLGATAAIILCCCCCYGFFAWKKRNNDEDEMTQDDSEGRTTKSGIEMGLRSREDLFTTERNSRKYGTLDRIRV